MSRISVDAVTDSQNVALKRYIQDVNNTPAGGRADEAETRAYADDMGFIYCDQCGAVVIPDGSDDPRAGHTCPSDRV